MTKLELENILSRTKYKPETGFRVVQKNGLLFLQHWQILRDVCRTGRRRAQTGRKFYISEHMTDSEVIQTALMAVLAFEEHEARESFRFDGAQLYGPHIDADALWSVSEKKQYRTG